MERKDLIYRMEKAAGAGFITRPQLAAFMGLKDPHSVDRYLKGVPKINRKLYFIPDVATNIMAAIQ